MMMTGGGRSMRGKTRIKTWGDFGAQQQQKQQLQKNNEIHDDDDDDAFPPLVGSAKIPKQRITVPPSVKPHQAGTRQSSLPPVCKQKTGNPNSETLIPSCTNKPNYPIQNKCGMDKLLPEKLKSFHPWSEDSLIEDNTLSSVAGAFQGACRLLDDTKVSSSSSCSSSCHVAKGDKAVTCPETEHAVVVESTVLDFETLRLIDVPAPPLEPEPEEDDLYLRHRKEALKYSRAAKRYSKKSQQAFQKGDHNTAKLMSVKAQELHVAASKLNGEAAEEILKIRNAKYNLWKLDLHGLHASEAVRALEDRLKILEYNSNNAKICLSSAPATNQCANESNLSIIHFPWKPFELEVITGLGTHSRSGASLPTVIKNYLIENGYKFGEGRPGVISVRPKFRYGLG